MTRALVFLLSFSLLFMACDKDKDQEKAYTIPDSYSEFTPKNYDDALSRLAMLAEMKAYMVTAHQGDQLDSVRLSAMYSNAQGANFSRNYSVDIKSKTHQPVREDFEKYIAKLAELSTAGPQSIQQAAGLHTSTTNGNTYLLDANGVEYLQVIEKGLMNACFYHQALAELLGEDSMNADNSTSDPVFGTAREHNWDLAFGYLGVAEDFPTNTTDVFFWGDYCNDRNAVLGTNSIMEGFLRGRAAISNKDQEGQQAGVEYIRQRWERVAGGTAIHYLNLAIEHENDPARRAHDLSEAIVFAQALPLNPETSMFPSEVAAWIQALAGSDQWDEMDLYAITNADIITARNSLAGFLNLNAEAPNL